MKRPPSLPLRNCRIRNFKAIRDSGVLDFTPLTVFIGNNGSGKSSAIEAMETLKTTVIEGVDAATNPWHGFEHVWNKAADHKISAAKPFPGACSNPMSFFVAGRAGVDPFRAKLEVTARDEHCDELDACYASAIGSAKFVPHPDYLMANYRVREPHMVEMVSGWQFLAMAPQEMTEPQPKRRTTGGLELARNGENIAEILQDIYDRDKNAFAGIIDAMKRVLPYAGEIRPQITKGIEKKIYLELVETGIADKLPGWLLSSGTVRIPALVALLRHPQPPSVLFVEEIENGLDPQTIQLLVEEMRYFVQSGTGQVVLTTHSPYLLDLLPLSSLIVVERGKSGSPVFTRPADQKALAEWAKTFAPGKLYTMGSLTRSGVEA